MSGEIRVLIIDNNSPFVLPLLRSFSGHPEFILDVLLITRKRPHHFRYSRHLHGLKIVERLDDQNMEVLLEESIDQFGSQMVIPTREWISNLLYRHYTELDEMVRIHPLPKNEILDIVTHKWRLNQWLADNRFPSARVARPEQGWEGGFPVLLKPFHGIGGHGIRKIDDPKGLRETLQNEGKYHENYFLQEYIAGYDIDVSFFAVEGEIIYHTIQKGLISGSFVYSKGIQFVRNESLLKMVSEIVSLLNYSGIAHLDFRYDESKQAYILVDFNARYWSSVQGSRAMGINFPYLAAMWTMEGFSRKTDYRTGYYFFSATALQVLWRKLTFRRSLPIRLRDTQLFFLLTDPLPELIYLLRQMKLFPGNR